MWKLLSGIALVVLLDVAFIWMIAAEPDAPEIARAIGPAAAAPVIHEPKISEPVAIDDSTEPVFDESFEVRDIRGSRSIWGGSGPRRRVARPDTAAVTAAAPAKLFQDTIIWIGRTEVPVKIDYREAAPVIAEPKQDEVHARVVEPRIARKKKRSFESKAFSVIKKPYDWMKAFVDKLH